MIGENLRVNIQFVSIFLAAACGVLALLCEYRDPITHRITKWGFIAMFGVILASLVAAVLIVLEYQDNVEKQQKTNEVQKQTNEQLEHLITNTQRTLESIERQVFRFQDEKFVVNVTLPLALENDSSLVLLKSMIEPEFERIYHEKIDTAKAKSQCCRTFSLEPYHVSQGGIAQFLLKELYLIVSIYDHEMKPDKFIVSDYPPEAGTRYRLKAAMENNNLKVTYGVGDRKELFFLSASELKPDLSFYETRKSVSITSIVDLIGKKIFISLGSQNVHFVDPNAQRLYNAAIKKMDPSMIWFTFYPGMTVSLVVKDDLTRHRDRSGRPFYIWQLPCAKEDLLQLFTSGAARPRQTSCS